MGIAAIGRVPPRGVINGVSSWDGWQKGDTAAFGVATTMIADPGAPSSVTTTYGDRQPVKSDGSVYPDNWYQGQTGDAVAEQLVADDQALLLGEVNAARGFLWYPPASQITDGAPTAASNIYSSLAYYLASPNVALHKFFLIIQSYWAAYDHNTPGTWLNFTNFRAAWLSLFQHAQYLKIGTRPVIGMYSNAPGTTQWDATRTNLIIADVTGAGMGAPYFVTENGDVTLANTLGWSGYTTYGPSPLPAGVGQLSYVNLYGQDKTAWSPAGSNQERILPIRTKLDTRPRGYAAWFDWPTYSEFELRLRRDYAMARSSRSLCANAQLRAYSLNELDEGGGSLPSPQEIIRGVNTPSRGLILDAFKNVIGGSFPATYDDHYHPGSVGTYFVRTGAGWAITQGLAGASGGTTAAYRYSELRSSTATNTWTFTSSANCVGLKLKGGKGVAYGSFDVQLDGGAATTINQNAGSESRNQLLYDSGVLIKGVHTLKVTVTTGCFTDEVIESVSR